MLLNELFEKQSIDCPEWLKEVFLEDEWSESEYSLQDDIHTWTFKNPLQHLKICFDGETYVFSAINDGETNVIEQRTEDSILNV